jgi:MFS family permease
VLFAGVLMGALDIAVAGDAFPEDKRGAALGLIGAVSGLAFIVGPILGGVLLRIGWQWLFLLAAPVSGVDRFAPPEGSSYS